MRILGLDVGGKRIGLAVSDPGEIVSEPLGVVEYTKEEEFFSKLIPLLKEKEIGEIIVGFPLNLDGSLSCQSEKVLAFIEKLKEKVSLPIKKWDERFTTKIATDLLIKADISRRKRKKLVDKISAAVILQSYLDSKCHPEC